MTQAVCTLSTARRMYGDGEPTRSVYAPRWPGEPWVFPALGLAGIFVLPWWPAIGLPLLGLALARMGYVMWR